MRGEKGLEILHDQGLMAVTRDVSQRSGPQCALV